MTRLVCTLELCRSRKLTHVVPVETIVTGWAEIVYPHDRALCGVTVRSDPSGIAWPGLADCPTCAARPESLTHQ